MKPPAGMQRVVFNLDESTWKLMKASMEAADLPHGHWLRAAVREKLDAEASDDSY